jgi:Methyltransferase domain
VSLLPRPCTRLELESPEFRVAASIIGELWSPSRKLWEFCALYEGFRELRLFRPACLGFGCGKEPLPVAFARLGGQVTATDQAPETAARWLQTDQYGGAEHYGGWNLKFRHVDMNEIPAELEGRFDFLWSSCALEHIGGLRAGGNFVLDAMRCLKPGGWALHTTELNVSSDVDTIDAADLCLFRRRDVDKLIAGLRAEGHRIEDAAWRLLDLVSPPGPKDRPHLSLEVGGFVTTSFFLAVQKSCST